MGLSDDRPIPALKIKFIFIDKAGDVWYGFILLESTGIRSKNPSVRMQVLQPVPSVPLGMNQGAVWRVPERLG